MSVIGQKGVGSIRKRDYAWVAVRSEFHSARRPPSKRSCRRETISGGQHFRIEILMPPPVSFDLRSSCQAPCWKYGLGNKRIRMDDRYSAIELLLNNGEIDRDGGRWWQEEK